MEGTRKSSRLRKESPPLPIEPPKKKPKTLKASKERSSPPRSASPKAIMPPAPRAASPRARAASPRARAASPNALEVHYYVHNTHIRPLIAIPINNPNLWPTRAVPFFRSTGTSNEGYGMFAGTWFPFVSMKDDAKMPGYLKKRQSGFIIKSSFIYEEDESNYSPKQKWIHELVDDYPVELSESIAHFLHLPSETETRVRFIELYNILNSKTLDITSPIYIELVRLLKDTIDYVFFKFLKYFLYPWQVMISRRLGGGYWDMNRELYNYIGIKLRDFDIVNAGTPIIDNTCGINDTEISCAISFLENQDAQMTLDQIRELETKEKPSITFDNLNSANIFYVNGKLDTYFKKLDQLQNTYESTKRAMAMMNSKSSLFDFLGKK